MHAAEHRDDVGIDLLGGLQRLFRRVDRRRDRGDADQVGLVVRDHLGERVLRQVLGHRIDELEVGEPVGLQCACQIRSPCRRPMAGDFCATGMIIRVNEKDAH
jgi:hypothetical protein